MTKERKQQMLDSALDEQCQKLVEIYCSNLVSLGRYKADEGARIGISNLLTAEIVFKTVLELE
jgi:hypothetical protein